MIGVYLDDCECYYNENLTYSIAKKKFKYFYQFWMPLMHIFCDIAFKSNMYAYTHVKGPMREESKDNFSATCDMHGKVLLKIVK